MYYGNMERWMILVYVYIYVCIYIIQVGVEAAGLQAIVRKLVGPYGILTSILNGKKSIMDVLAPIVKPAMGSLAEEVMAAIKQV